MTRLRVGHLIIIINNNNTLKLVGKQLTCGRNDRTKSQWSLEIQRECIVQMCIGWQKMKGNN